MGQQPSCNLKSKGFIALAKIDSHMPPPEESHAILSLFDGGIRITEKETSQGRVEVLRIWKLCNQRYVEDELIMTKKACNSEES